MDALQEIFLEGPLGVYLALIFAEVVLAGWWYESRRGGAKLAMLVPPILAVMVLGVSTLIVTDRQEILRAAKTIARQAEAGRLEALEELLDDDYAGFGNDKAGAIAVAKSALRNDQVYRVRFTRLQVQVEGGEAAMHAATVVEFGDARFGSGRTGVIFEVRWIRRPGGWRIIHVRPPRLGVEVF